MASAGARPVIGSGSRIMNTWLGIRDQQDGGNACKAWGLKLVAPRHVSNRRYAPGPRSWGPAAAAAARQPPRRSTVGTLEKGPPCAQPKQSGALAFKPRLQAAWDAGYGVVLSVQQLSVPSAAAGQGSLAAAVLNLILPTGKGAAGPHLPAAACRRRRCCRRCLLPGAASVKSQSLPAAATCYLLPACRRCCPKLQHCFVLLLLLKSDVACHCGGAV